MILFSCAKGRVTDTIQLSGNAFSLSSNTDSVMVTTKGLHWLIATVSLNTNVVFTSNDTAFNSANCNFIYTDSNFQITRRNCDTLLVKMNENKTNFQRILTIQLEAGDYFGNIDILQSK